MIHFAFGNAISGHKKVPNESEDQGPEPFRTRCDCWIGHGRNQASALAVALLFFRRCKSLLFGVELTPRINLSSNVLRGGVLRGASVPPCLSPNL